MPSHKVQKSGADKLKQLLPFGVGLTKPKHFRDMLKVVWENKDNLGYAWKVVTKGVCDGCALGVAGLHDWTIDGVHLCMTRLNLLRLNTMPALNPALLENVDDLAKRPNAELRKLGRLPYPMLRRKGEKGFTRISWDEAYSTLADKLRDIDPKRLAFFVTSRGVTNEVYYVAQKVARFLGTNNVENAARLCHSPSTAAMKAAIGVAATTCSYKDFYGTDLVVFFGANPANDQPVLTKYLHEAKKLGTKIVLVNPYNEPGMARYWVPSSAGSALFGTDITDYWFPVSQGGDIAFLYGVLKILFAEGWLNDEFIDQNTVDVQKLRAETEQISWKDIERQAGLGRESIQEFAELIRDAKNAVLVWSMGITQHPWGADGVQMILNLGLLRGYVGRDKNGLMPIRGHSSVQGGAEMGAYSTAFPGGVPINRTAAAAGVEESASSPTYRLVVAHAGTTVSLTREDLLAMPQRSEELPIACVEGWSASAVWTGVRLRDLLDLVDAPRGAEVEVTSLQERGAFRATLLQGNFADDDRTLVALALSGEPLDLDHGYPARLIAPNRPGVLQTKWLSRLEAVT